VAGESNMKLDTPKMTVTVDKKLTQNINDGKESSSLAVTVSASQISGYGFKPYTGQDYNFANMTQVLVSSRKKYA
jgi:hypothetical protein